MTVLRTGLLLLIATMLLGSSAAAKSLMIDDFNSGIDAWQPSMQFGKVDAVKPSPGKGVDDSGALRIDYDFQDEGTNHICFSRAAELDLLAAEGVTFQVKGTGDKISVFLFIWDSRGLFNNYGPHGTNFDFHSAHPDWHTCKVTFSFDRSVQGGVAELGDIKRIGFMLHSAGPAKGTVEFDNLQALEGVPHITVTPPAISPNGDGVNDEALIEVYGARDAAVTVEVLDSAGELVATLARNEAVPLSKFWAKFSGKRVETALPNGDYTVCATVKAAKTHISSAKLAIRNRPKWPPINYKAEPFFPTGVWFEGAPSLAGSPADPAGAAAYYDRCFADLAAHGFNAAAVPNCPEELWEPLLASAAKNKVKVVLDVGPLTEIISRPQPATEDEVIAAAKPIVAKIGKYESLLRYQTRDEPFVQMIPNWLLVQRILATLDPAHPAFSCFCQSEPLELVLRRSQLSEVVFDIYPFGPKTPTNTLGGFLGSLDLFVLNAGKNTKWPVLQAFAAPGTWRYPTAEELRATTYLALAAGAKGLFYFIYQSMPNRVDKMDGLVDPQGRPQPIYEAATALARELGQLAPLVISLTPSDAPGQVHKDFRAGSFTDPKGRPVLIVASTRPGAAVAARVNAAGASEWKDALSGDTFKASENAIELPLPAGAGRVLVGE